MTPTAALGDSILVAAVVTIGLLEVRRHRRRARSPVPNIEHARRSRGQVIVELALVLPFALFAVLGAIEAGFLLIDKAQQDRGTQVVADWLAANPGRDPEPVLHRVDLDDCDVQTHETPGLGLLEVDVTCAYRPVVTSNLWAGLPVSSEASAALDPEPSPTPSPTPEPSPSEEVPS